MKKEIKFKKVIDLTAESMTDLTGLVYFWVDDQYYYPMKVEDYICWDINTWTEVVTEIEEQEFEEAPYISNLLKDLSYTLVHIEIFMEGKKRKIQGYCQHIDSGEERYILLYQTHVIEFHYMSMQQIPILIDTRLLIDQNAPITKQFPDFTITDLEMLIDKKEEEMSMDSKLFSNTDEDDMLAYSTKSSSDNEERKQRNAWKKFEKSPDTMSSDELKELIKSLEKSQEFEKAAKVLDYLQQKVSKD